MEKDGEECCQYHGLANNGVVRYVSPKDYRYLSDKEYSVLADSLGYMKSKLIQETRFTDYVDEIF